jgi:hypothetical protein
LVISATVLNRSNTGKDKDYDDDDDVFIGVHGFVKLGLLFFSASTSRCQNADDYYDVLYLISGYIRHIFVKPGLSRFRISADRCQNVGRTIATVPGGVSQSAARSVTSPPCLPDN